MLHHKVPDLRFRVSTAAPPSNPSGSVLEVASASNPSDSSSVLNILEVMFPSRVYTK
jgi:hypothetical protein